MDRDESPIGGLKKPLQPTKQLFIVSVVMDVIAVITSLFVSYFFALGILLYILASRAYSYRKIRLKQYPVIGFLSVFIFQGAAIFFISYHAVDSFQTLSVPLIPCVISSLLIGALYPLTQIYQHEDDRRDGITTISYLLGKRGTFIFSIILFLTATVLMYLLFRQQGQMHFFYLFLLINAPLVLYFLYWMSRVWQNERAATFENSLRMNMLSSVCTTSFFIVLLIHNH